MNYTEHHHLPQWESSDRVLRSDFNDAMATIDTSLAATGNCKIILGSYTGNGNIDKSVTLQFDSQPLALFLLGGNYSIWLLYGSSNWSWSHSDSSTPIGVKWENNSVYWWYAGNEHSAAQMFNAKDTVYQYLALLQP